MADAISLRIPRELRLDLARLSRQQKRPVSEIAREAIRRYVIVERFRALRARALPLAEAEGLLTDEDVFRLVS